MGLSRYSQPRTCEATGRENYHGTAGSLHPRGFGVGNQVTHYVQDHHLNVIQFEAKGFTAKTKPGDKKRGKMNGV